MKNISLVAIATILFVSSCKKDSTDINAGDTGSLVLEFDNVVGGSDLTLNSETYTNASGEDFTISTLDYFISNIKLQAADGRTFEVPKDSSYFLIKEENAGSHKIQLNNIPAGDYTSFTFTVGVDSLKSTAPISERTGVLDPGGAAAGMYWSWNSGYIFLKMEGSSPSSTTEDKKVYYHVGGFGGYNSPTLNNIKTVTIQAPDGMLARVRQDKEHAPTIHIFADAAKILDGDNDVSIATNSMVHFSEVSAVLADNYAHMFSIDHIHND